MTSKFFFLFLGAPRDLAVYQNMKFAICNEVFGTSQTLDDWKTVCNFVASVGYDGIEIAPFTFAADVREISPSQRTQVKAIAESCGLEICALHWLLVSPPGLHINAINKTLRRETIDYLKALIHFAGDLGARKMIFGSPKARFVEDDFESTWQRTRQSFDAVLPVLKEREIILCLESLPAPECDFIQTVAQAEQMVNEINHLNFQLMLDAKSLSAEQNTPVELIGIYGRNCAHFHANDANRRAPGFGATDFAAILQALRAREYRDWVSIEPFDYFPDPRTLARESLAYLRSC